MSQQRGLHLAYLTQGDELPADATVRHVVLHDLDDHEWAAAPATREVVDVLLAGLDLDRPVDGLSGGERRRCSLARLLLGDHDLIVLDEPTNHLDVEAVAWLAAHLAARDAALVVVTHDRWFLDAVCDRTWEVHDGVVDVYDGGYAAFVLAKAERPRQAAASETRRRNLVRKELAWLRRGAPARTVEAEVPHRRGQRPDRGRAASARPPRAAEVRDPAAGQGRARPRGRRPHPRRRESCSRTRPGGLGPGDRVGIVGVNGAGKTSVLGLLSGEVKPQAGRVRTGRTVALAQLTQQLDDLAGSAQTRWPTPGCWTPSSRSRGSRARPPVTSPRASMLERFGFTGDKLTTRIGDLSGGERRRLQLMRLLLSEPNVLLLDEPTNDLDIETLNVMEDFLDSWPGTLVVVSHDRYFLERTCDTIWALLGDGQIRMLPRGVDEYLEHRAAQELASTDDSQARPPDPPGAAKSGSAEEREAKKVVARIDKQLAKLAEREEQLHSLLAEHASDYEKLAEVDADLRAVLAEKEALEEEWLEAASVLE